MAQSSAQYFSADGDGMDRRVELSVTIKTNGDSRFELCFPDEIEVFRIEKPKPPAKLKLYLEESSAY